MGKEVWEEAAKQLGVLAASRRSLLLPIPPSLEAKYREARRLLLLKGRLSWESNPGFRGIRAALSLRSFLRAIRRGDGRGQAVLAFLRSMPCSDPVIRPEPKISNAITPPCRFTHLLDEFVLLFSVPTIIGALLSFSPDDRVKASAVYVGGATAALLFFHDQFPGLRGFGWRHLYRTQLGIAALVFMLFSAIAANQFVITSSKSVKSRAEAPKQAPGHQDEFWARIIDQLPTAKASPEIDIEVTSLVDWHGLSCQPSKKEIRWKANGTIDEPLAAWVEVFEYDLLKRGYKSKPLRVFSEADTDEGYSVGPPAGKWGIRRVDVCVELPSPDDKPRIIRKTVETFDSIGRDKISPMIGLASSSGALKAKATWAKLGEARPYTAFVLLDLLISANLRLQLPGGLTARILDGKLTILTSSGQVVGVKDLPVDPTESREATVGIWFSVDWNQIYVYVAGQNDPILSAEFARLGECLKPGPVSLKVFDGVKDVSEVAITTHLKRPGSTDETQSSIQD